MDCRLDGQVALVTGASSGIGTGVARGLAAAGAAVIVNYHSGREPAEALVAEIEGKGGRAVALQADVSDPESVAALFAQGAEAMGAIDVVVANSGIQKDAPATELTVEDWRKVIDTNLTGQFLCAQAGIRQFLKQGDRKLSRALGKIIHMSSVHEVIPWAGHVNYAASKGGIALMMRTLAQETAGRRIRINAIAPGAIATRINAENVAGEAGKRLLELIPYGRIGDVEDIANATVWLASDMSDYVVGTTITVDGGMCLYPGFRDNG